MALTGFPPTRDQTIQPGQPIPSTTLNAIQDAIVTLQQHVVFQPTIVGLDSGDYTEQRGYWQRLGFGIYFSFEIEWTNTTGAIDADPVEVNLPWRAADTSPASTALQPQPPFNTFGFCNLNTIGSKWATSVGDRSIHPFIIQSGGTQDLMIFERLSTSNTTLSPPVPIDNVETRVVGFIQYLTEGTLLV